MSDLVTITGADDGVDPCELVALSREFPFVEWAILMSSSRSATPRYPSAKWQIWLLDTLGESDTQARFALHVCGRIACDLQLGDPGPVRGALAAGTIYSRVQINGFELPLQPKLRDLAHTTEVEFILQARSVDQFEDVCIASEDLPRASVLFDVSGGTGVSPTQAPAFVVHRAGFAGGINPDNVASIFEFADQNGYSWIDMESGVRTDDRFDLSKVRAVLETCARLRGAR